MTAEVCMSRDEGSDSDADDEPVPPPPAPSDPFERARAALRDAKQARGLDPDAVDEEDVPVKRDVQSVLERAAAAREQAAVGRAGLEREARAREELARIKAGKSILAAPDEEDAEEPKPAENGPRPRRL
jgi:hypothetical protein